MEDKVSELASVAAEIVGKPLGEVHAGQVCNSKKVSDHHAIVPTMTAGSAGLSALPAGERAFLGLIAQQVLCAVGSPHIYAETAVTLDCGGAAFTAKGKTVLSVGWKACLEQEQADKPLPELFEGMSFPVESAVVKEDKTTPPKRYTEDTLLFAMETAGAKEAPNDAERKGLGTPATRAAVLEKLVSTGFLERKKAKKAVSLVPSGRPVVGKCPRCGGDVTESKADFFCESNACRFGLWKDNKYLSAKKIILTKRMVSALLKDRRTFISGIYSEKTGKTYDAFLTLRDDGARTSFGIEFQ